jgi:hypothetical protein
LYLAGKSYKSFLKTVYLSQDDEISQQLMLLHNQVVTSFGLKNSCTHIEFIVNSNGEAFFCEAAARPPAAGFLKLHQIQRGKNSIELFGSSLFEESITESLRKKDEITPGLIGFTPHGKVQSFTRLSDFKMDWIVHKEEASNLDEIGSGRFTIELGRIYIKAKNKEECISRLTEIGRKFDYQIS